MASDDINGNHKYCPDAPERQEILERLYANLVTLITTYCPGEDPSRIDAFLRNIDFSGADDTDRWIYSHLIPELTALILPADADEEGTFIHAFYRNLNDAVKDAGTLHLINDENSFATEEYLKSLVAELRATALFAGRLCCIDCAGILEQKLPFILGEMIIRTDHAIPAKLMRKVTAEDRSLYDMEYLPTGQRYTREKERDDTIERTISEYGLSQDAMNDNPEKALEIRTIIRDAIWKVWEKKEKAIKDTKRLQFETIKLFLLRYPDLAALVPWLLG